MHSGIGWNVQFSLLTEKREAEGEKALDPVRESAGAYGCGKQSEEVVHLQSCLQFLAMWSKT